MALENLEQEALYVAHENRQTAREVVQKIQNLSLDSLLPLEFFFSLALQSI